MLLSSYVHPDTLIVQDNNTLYFSDSSDIWSVHVFITDEQRTKLLAELAPAEAPLPVEERSVERPMTPDEFAATALTPCTLIHVLAPAPDSGIPEPLPTHLPEGVPLTPEGGWDF